MFMKLQNEQDKNKYYDLLKAVGGLSRLFSDSPVPYLYYRSAENVFCKAFEADNLSRSDCSADARMDKIGLGLKTFLNNNGRTFQKIAEFNKNRSEYMDNPNLDELIRQISTLRNKRIKSTKIIHGVDDMIYHCVAREKNKFLIYEETMDYIDTERIKIISKKENTILFEDSINEYNFNISKSTLFKRFNTPEDAIDIQVNILDDPFDIIKKLYSDGNNLIRDKEKEIESVILPLYSTSQGKVMEKSGLNQWNAAGRTRHENEVYIPVPAIIHRRWPSFFPLKDHTFNLVLPNKKIISAKMCQNAKMEINGRILDKGKGLMSNPNADLGKWILRDILNIKPGNLVTMEDLYSIGIDSLEVRKINNNYYEIDFKEIGSYEEFILQTRQ